MSERLIPNGDAEFAQKAGIFARAIAKEPTRFALTAADAEAMMEAATRFSAAVHALRYGGERSKVATRAKDEARAEAARLYKRCVNIIRMSEQVDDATRMNAGLRISDGKKRARNCPQEPPYLKFVQALHQGNTATPMHELQFRAAMGGCGNSKPAGAVRLELFVDLVPPGEAVPPHPGANLGGRPWYLRSYSRSPIRLEPPNCRVPMMVVYWGRWADATGNVGPWSRTVMSRIEGGWEYAQGPLPLGSRKPAPILEDQSATGPASRDQKYSVAVLDAQYQAINPQRVPHVAPPQLEGPAESEAA